MSHGTRTSVFLHHPSQGTMEFAWSTSDYVIVCFHSAKLLRAPAIDYIGVLFHIFEDRKPVHVEKNLARNMWNALIERDEGWKSSNIVGNPPSAVIQIAEQGVPLLEEAVNS